MTGKAELLEGIEAEWDRYEAIAAAKKIRQEHPPLFDVLDNIYDCGNPDCPSVGYPNGESAEAHYFVWRLAGAIPS